MALTALVTDHWIAPTGAALPFISHAGLWKVCFVPTATQEEGRVEEGAETFVDIDQWWDELSGSYLDLPGGVGVGWGGGRSNTQTQIWMTW